MPEPTASERGTSFLLNQLVALIGADSALPAESTPAGFATHEFFKNSWENATRESERNPGLLTRTKKWKVEPIGLPAPHVYTFELYTPFKRKTAPDAQVELVEGPIRGTIRYRPDYFAAPEGEPTIVVFLDPAQHLFHPNFSRRHGVLCTGDLPRPFELDALLVHLYGILSYQNRSTTDPADAEAAHYFALNPGAMDGLENPEPLY